jgi:hypothetical protein
MPLTIVKALDVLDGVINDKLREAAEEIQ